MTSHEIDYKILGDDIQVLEIELDPNETVIAEAGAMNYLQPEITFEAKMGDGSNPNSGLMDKIFSIGKRAITGESLFMTHFTNRAREGKKTVAFSAPYPGKIVPMNLAELGGDILCEKGAFLAAAFGTQIGIAFSKKIGAGLFGGDGFILQRLRGSGLAFVHAGGTIVKKELNNETILVDTGCLVAMTKSINYEIQKSGSLKSMVLGGEGIFLTKLSGTGTVWLQSMPFSRLAARMVSATYTRIGEGSILGGLGRILDR